MKPCAPFALAGLLAFGVAGATGAGFAPQAQTQTQAQLPAARRVALPPALVLRRYAKSLAAVREPKSLVFQYTVEQLGLHDLEQSHRVYRSGVSERDETLVVDGYTLQYPSIRIFRNRLNRYGVAAVAPRPGSYAFAFAGLLARAGGDSYAFKTARGGTSAFAVSEIEIDGRTFLPSVIRFKLGTSGAHSSGVLTYGRADAYWLVRQASVSARLSNGATARERITWSNYQFPVSLPGSVFAPPRAVPTPLAAPTATPVPVTAPLSPN